MHLFALVCELNTKSNVHDNWSAGVSRMARAGVSHMARDGGASVPGATTAGYCSYAHHLRVVPVVKIVRVLSVFDW